MKDAHIGIQAWHADANIHTQANLGHTELHGPASITESGGAHLDTQFTCSEVASNKKVQKQSGKASVLWDNPAQNAGSFRETYHPSPVC